MRLPLTLRRAGATIVDIVVTVEPGSTIGEVAAQIARADPARGFAGPVDQVFTVGLVDSATSSVLDRRLPLDASGIHPGSTIELVPAGSRYTDEIDPTAAAATLIVTAGPDRGRTFPLRVGVNQIGRSRSSDVCFSDPLVSKHHARINVTDVVEIIDLQSSNGLVVDDERLDRVQLRRDQTVLVGDTAFRVEHRGGATALHPLIPFNRSPRLDPVYAGQKFVAPEPPRLPPHARFPMIQLLVPILMGVVLYAITKQIVTIAFIALSPLMMVGMFAENRRAGKQILREETELFRAALAALADDLTAAAKTERQARRHEHPSGDDVVRAVQDRTPLLWTRRPGERGFLELRLGLGARPSRNTVELPSTNATTPDLWHELQELPARFVLTPGVPVVADLALHGAIGLGGPRARTGPSLRSLVAQLSGLHSPAELVIAAMASPDTAREWEWLKWLPHVTSDHTPIGAEHLAAAPGAIDKVTAELEEIIDQRRAASGGRDASAMPACVLVVDDTSSFDRSRINEILEKGPEVGVHVLWVSAEVAQLPAACRAYIDLADEVPVAGLVTDQIAIDPILPDQLDEIAIEVTARRLAALYDAGAPRADEAELPSVVSYLDLVGLDAGTSPDWVLEHWRANHSIPAESGEPASRPPRSDLAAVVGRSSPVDVLRLDLRSQGPHALVGGTTGAGKSEFLQTWIAGLALAYSPARVTFLFVDYKGGAAFADYATLPHTVGIVTDLNRHLVKRALTSLQAELRYREEVLQRKRAKDVLELERRGDPETPPSLVIVVDEFAALISELPEFVDGVVNVAQRGRSLGLHLILATQRPKGVIKENLRANTNLRVALRVADEEDSSDVVGAALAAAFDPAIPGRGVAKAGPGRLTSFQTAYVGGWSAKVSPEPAIEIAELRFGLVLPWESPVPIGSASVTEELGLTDLQLVVANIRTAAQAAGLAEPRKPWLPALPDMLDLDEIRRTLTDAELVFGRIDEPDLQQQGSAAFVPDRDGSMAVFGTGGSGKSTFLRTLAIVAGLTARGGPCHVYAIDSGSRGLQVLEDLPHVGSVITGDDEERIARLLRMLRSLIDDRAGHFAKVDAGTLDDYRRSSSRPDEPRVLLLIDGFAQFRQNYEIGRPAFFDQLQQIASDGRQHGVHLVLTADRGPTIPSSLASAIQRRLVLRLASENDYYGLAEAEPDALADAPPGRAFFDGREVQVAVLAGTNDVAQQAAAVRALAVELRRNGALVEAPPIERLSEHVELGQLPATVDGLPAFGIAEDTLEPIGFAPIGSLLVVGPHGSGRTTVTTTLASALRRAVPDVQLVLFTLARSALAGAIDWNEIYTDVDAVAEASARLQRELKDGATGTTAVVIESFPDFVQSISDPSLELLIKAARSMGVTVIAEGETSSVIGAYGGFATAVKADRQGLALQPEQTDGDILFKTPFPRVSRAAFPAGRGLYVSAGRLRQVQCAVSTR